MTNTDTLYLNMTPAMTGGDTAMRAHGAQQPVPQFDTPAFTPLGKPLSEARVAIVTSAALHRPDQDRFSPVDASFRALDRADRNLVLGPPRPCWTRTP